MTLDKFIGKFVIFTGYAITQQPKNKMEHEFEIALSFAGEDREYVDKVATLLQKEGVKIFYDSFEEANLWGKNLYDYLSDIYRNKAKFTIMFISEHYEKKLWTNHERTAMQARAFQESQEYILPARFDSTVIPGVLPTISYITLKNRNPEEFVSIIKKKLVFSGSTIPSESLRKSLTAVTLLPNREDQKVTIEIKNSEYLPIQDATVVLSSENGTYLSVKTAANGKATFNMKIRRLYSLLVAHKDYPSYLQPRFDPENDIELEITKSDNCGSIIIQSTGYIENFKGRLNPIYDSSKRMYLYADNISINNGQNQPVRFETDKPLSLEDCEGNFIALTFRFINGSTTALADYVKSNIA